MDYESVSKSRMPGKVRLKAGRLGLWWEDKGLVVRFYPVGFLPPD